MDNAHRGEVGHECVQQEHKIRKNSGPDDISEETVRIVVKHKKDYYLNVMCIDNLKAVLSTKRYEKIIRMNLFLRRVKVLFLERIMVSLLILCQCYKKFTGYCRYY